ncbi:hypothetical protein MTP99_004845 [Tenebrio molitor]|nr:hypothetical protein MTP99_004845 [Tenebrio molitor]
MDVCVCLLGADGRVVEGRINTLSATTARSARVRVPSGRALMGRWYESVFFDNRYLLSDTTDICSVELFKDTCY